jgi:hypothetical protein
LFFNIFFVFLQYLYKKNTIIMIQLVLILFIMCGSIGVTISKMTTEYGPKRQRQHTEPLKVDKDVIS